MDDYHLTFPVGYDASGSISGLYRVEATPTSIFIAKDGRIDERQEGALEEAYFEQKIEKLLAG